MLAYSMTNTSEDGPILSNPERTRPISTVNATLNGLMEANRRRHSKLATDKMGHASTATLTLNRP